jgi:nitrogenase-stabilizing/protective protein
MTASELDLNFEELSSAEDFLEYFDIAYDPRVVQVNRLHILQRFHDYLRQYGDLPSDPEAKQTLYRQQLRTAYNDFVTSDAQTEKVFRVFHRRDPQVAFVSLDSLSRQPSVG